MLKGNPDSNYEERRVRELLGLNILDTPDEKEFDDIAKVAAYLCDVNHAHIHFLGHNRQWAKSCYGWDLKEMPREESICHYTIQQEKYMIVNNLLEDNRFSKYDYIKEKGLQFYAGIVLKSNGYNVGTLCVFGEEPKQISEQQLESLQVLGKEVEAQLELRVKREELINEHKELKKSATFLRNSTDIRLITESESLKIVEVNTEVEELLGYNPEHLKGTLLTDFISGSEFKTNLKNWISNKAPQKFSSETILKSKDKESFWFRITITREEDYYYITGRNISRRKRSEQRFLRQAQLTEDIIQHLPGLFFLVDEEGQVRKWNNNLVDVANRTPQETQNRSYTNFIAPNHHQKAQEALSKVFQEGYARTELDFVSKEGKVTPILLVAFRYQTGNSTYATGIGIDISDKTQAIEELERKEQKLKKAQRIGRIGSWTWHLPTNELYWSDQVYEIYGLDKDTFNPSLENYWKLLPEGEQEKVNNLVKRIREGQEWEDIEIKIKKPDGSIAYIYERAEVRYDETGQPVEVLGTMQDVTDRRQNEKKLEAALKEKEVLLAEVHHRVKNNLAVINSFLQLEIFNTENDQLKRVLSQNQMRIHSMALIHETLYSIGDFANISFGKYLEKLTTSLLNTFQGKSNDIKINLNTEEIKLNINQAIPCALLVNELVTNCFKHAFPNAETGTIKIELWKVKNTIHMKVADNGIGFNAKKTLQSSQTLGLTLVDKLINQINADLEINLNKGTSFQIKFTKKQTRGSSASYFPESP